MSRRVFIAINLPEDIKKKITEWQSAHQDLPFHWTKKDSLHITLVFIGYTADEQILEFGRMTREVVKPYKSFKINLKKFYYGPPGKSPRMVWLEGEINAQLTKLKIGLEQSLLQVPDSEFSRLEKRAFKPHITVGRSKNFLNSSLVSLKEEVDWSFSVDSIEIMESDLKKDGAEYIILESMSLV